MSKKVMPRSAGVLIAVGLYLLVHVVYMLLGTVNLVFVKDGEVLCRQDNVSSLSSIKDPLENMDEETYAENSDTVFTYTYFGEEKIFGEDMFNFRCKIALNVIGNLISFRWSESSHDIILNAYE